MKKNIIIKIIMLCMVIFVLGFIYYNSSKDFDASNQMSYKVIDKIQGIVNKVAKKQIEPYKLNLIIRKVAHAFEFFCLAVVTSIVLKRFNVKWFNIIIYTLFLVLIFAVFDEYHQIGVSGRNSRVTDVIIDFGGGILGTFLVMISISIYNLIKAIFARKKK